MNGRILRMDGKGIARRPFAHWYLHPHTILHPDHLQLWVFQVLPMEYI